MARTKQELYKNRPTSPHLSVYRMVQMSSGLSIMHRLTGIGLFFSMSVFAWWFILWVFSRFDPTYLDLTQYKIIKLALILTSFAGFFHLTNGIRHLSWDAGLGFSKTAIDITGWMVILSSGLLTMFFWIFIV